MTTTRLYWQDAYLVTAPARVLDVDGTTVVLDATPFHAHGGGQPGDTGAIVDQRVIDTRASEDRRIIFHHLESPPTFAAGDEVTTQIDWERRYALMRHHTLLHLVHLAVRHIAGDVAPGGTQVGEDKARIEYALHASLDIAAVEAVVRDLVTENLPATTAVVADGTRCWEIPGWSPIPCGGTHVERLCELDSVSLRAKSAGRRGIRIYATSTLTQSSSNARGTRAP
jgi:alanyl-tRNA synthetase